MKSLIVIALVLTTFTAVAETRVQKVKKTTKSTEYVPATSTDTTVINKDTQIKPGEVRADGTVVPPTKTTTTKKTRKY